MRDGERQQKKTGQCALYSDLPIPVFAFFIGVIVHKVSNTENSDKIQKTKVDDNLTQLLDAQSMNRDIQQFVLLGFSGNQMGQLCKEFVCNPADWGFEAREGTFGYSSEEKNGHYHGEEHVARTIESTSFRVFFYIQIPVPDRTHCSTRKVQLKSYKV